MLPRRAVRVFDRIVLRAVRAYRRRELTSGSTEVVPYRARRRIVLIAGVPITVLGLILGVAGLESSSGSDYFWADPAKLELPEHNGNMLYVDARNHRNVSLEVNEYLRSEHPRESLQIRQALDKCEALPNNGIENRACQNIRTDSVEIARELLYGDSIVF